MIIDTIRNVFAELLIASVPMLAGLMLIDMWLTSIGERLDRIEAQLKDKKGADASDN